jgi:hypothetical protein
MAVPVFNYSYENWIMKWLDKRKTGPAEMQFVNQWLDLLS